MANRQRLNRPSHLLATAAVFLLLGGLGWGVAGVTAAPREEAMRASDRAWAEPLRIGIPHEGDRGTYEVTHEADAPGQPEPSTTTTWGSTAPMNFEWGADREATNATGARHWANVLRTSQQDEGVWANATDLLYAGTTRSLAREFFQSRIDTAPAPASVIPLVPRGTSTQESSYVMTQFTDWNAGLHMCGLRSSVQGHSLPLDGTHISADMGCDLLAAFVGDPMYLAAEGVGGEEGRREARFAAYDPLSNLPRAWIQFREDVAYPVRIEMPSMGMAIPGRWVLTLTALEEGTVALRGVEPTGQDLGPLELADRPAWMLDERGIEHAFPLSAAFAYARDNPSCSELGEFLATRPEAYVAWARHATFVMPEGAQWRWDFAVTDGADLLGIQVLHGEPASRAAGPVPPTPLDPTATPGKSCSKTNAAPFGDEIVLLRPDELPSKTPTVAALMSRWQAHAGPDYRNEAGNTWEFMFARDTDGAGGQPGLWFSAGRLVFTRTAGPTYPYMNDYSDTWEKSLVASYEQWNRVDRLDEQRSAYYPGAPPARLMPPVTADQSPATTTSVLLSGITAFVLIPSGPAAAGISFGALFGAAIYYLWPAVKAGGLGLFSRVRTDKLLEHPMRARMMQAIEAQPGIHQQALVRLAGGSASATDHHLAKLVAAGLIVKHAGKGYTCYFVKGTTDRRAMAAAPILKSPVAQAILLAAQTRPGTPPSVIARELGVSAPTVSYHLRRLEQAGLVSSAGGIKATGDGMMAA